MPWVRFHRNFDHRPSSHVMRAYKAGRWYLTSQRAAKEAISAGAGIACDRDGKPIEAENEGGDEQAQFSDLSKTVV